MRWYIYSCGPFSMYEINSYSRSNDNKLINNTEFVKVLYGKIQVCLKRPPNTNEKQYVRKILSADMPEKYRNRSPSEILNEYVAFFVNRFKNNNPSYDQVDYHEISKSMIGLDSESNVTDFSKTASQTFATSVLTQSTVGVSSFLGITDPQKYAALFLRLPTAGTPSGSGGVIKQEYITLDSRYRSLDNDGTAYFKWNAVYDNSDIQGGFNINQRVRDIVALKSYPIKLPYVASADNDFGRITLLFQEIQSLAFIGHENTKYQFIYSTDVVDRWIHLRTHNNNDGLFQFYNPVTQLSSLTAYFRSPWQPIVFDQDRLSMNVPNPSGYASKTTFTSVAKHNLETGDLVYISGFTSINTSSDGPIIGNVNTTYGNIVTYEDDYTFSIDVDSSNMYKSGAGTINVTNGSTLVTGAGTAFISLFQIGDGIRILPSNTQYIISSISSDTMMILTSPISEATGAYSYLRNNIPTTTNNIYVYLGSKRIFMNFVVSYIESVITYQ